MSVTTHSSFPIRGTWAPRLLAHLGFEALATTSMGYAFSVGRRDNTLDRQETMAYACTIASATDLPVSADLENGLGDTPEIVTETIGLAAAAGVVGAQSKMQPGARIILFMKWTMRLSGSARRQQRRVPFPFPSP